MHGYEACIVRYLTVFLIFLTENVYEAVIVEPYHGVQANGGGGLNLDFSMSPVPGLEEYMAKRTSYGSMDRASNSLVEEIHHDDIALCPVR